MKKSLLFISLLLPLVKAYAQSDSFSYVKQLIYKGKPPELYNELRLGSRLDRNGEVFAGRYLGLRYFSILNYGIYVEKVFMNQSEKDPVGRTSITRIGPFAGGSLQITNDLEISFNLLLFAHSYYDKFKKSNSLVPNFYAEFQSGLLYRLDPNTKISLFHGYSPMSTPRYQNLALGLRTCMSTTDKMQLPKSNRLGILLNRMGITVKHSRRSDFIENAPYRTERFALMNEIGQPEFRYNYSLGFVWLDSKQNAFSLSYGQNQYSVRLGPSWIFNNETGFLSSLNRQFTFVAECNLVQFIKDYKYSIYPVIRFANVYERMNNTGLLHGYESRDVMQYGIREEIKSRGWLNRNTLAMGLAFNHAGIYLSASMQFFEYQYRHQLLNQYLTTNSRKLNSGQPFLLEGREGILSTQKSHTQSFRPALQFSAAVLLVR